MLYAAGRMSPIPGQLQQPAVAIAYLDAARLRRALLAGIANLLADQEHLNKINVYPVADGDTGTNLSLTLHSIVSQLADSDPQHAGRFLVTVADAAIDGARGNSGAILAQFLQGISDYCTDLGSLDAGNLAAACGSGARYAREAMSNPVEGTILTVLDDFAKALQHSVDNDENDIAILFSGGYQAARASLENTPNLLDSLRKAGVVDAGAAGFVDLLAGIDRLLRDGTSEELPDIDFEVDYTSENTAGESADLRYRYCTECLVRGDDLDRRKLREQLTTLGDSLVLAGSQTRARVHIHTNDPDAVFATAAQYGMVSGEKADDMQRQQDLVHAAAQPVVIATDTGGDVPDDLAEKLRIYQTSVRVHFGRRSYLDKVGISAAQLYEMIRSNPEAPKTSQPPPGDFRRQFQFLASHYRHVLSINLTAKASGTFQAAQTAAASVGDTVTVIDSHNASLGQGLLVIDAAELAARGASLEKVYERVLRMRSRTFTFGALPNLSHGVRGGRVSPWVKTVANTLHLVPVLGNKPDGQVKPVGVLFGRTNIVERFARFIVRRIDIEKTYRLAVGHADCETDGRALLAALSKLIPNRKQTLFTRIGTALGVHTGPEGLVVGVQEFDTFDE